MYLKFEQKLQFPFLVQTHELFGCALPRLALWCGFNGVCTYSTKPNTIHTDLHLLLSSIFPVGSRRSHSLVAINKFIWISNFLLFFFSCFLWHFFIALNCTLLASLLWNTLNSSTERICRTAAECAERKDEFLNDLICSKDFSLFFLSFLTKILCGI